MPTDRTRLRAFRTLLITLCLLPTPWQTEAAQQALARGPVTIQADQAELSQQEGLSVYTGNVRLTQGELVITGDRLVVRHSQEGRPLQARVTGSPATYDQPTSADSPSVHGQARHIEYNAESDILVLEGSARVTRGRNMVEGAMIRYDRRRHRILATGDGDGRVQIILTPSEHDNGDRAPAQDDRQAPERQSP